MSRTALSTAAPQRIAFASLHRGLDDRVDQVWLAGEHPHDAVVPDLTSQAPELPGVVRALAGRLREPLEEAERGPLLETYVLHELRAWQNLSQCGGNISYWRTPAGSEVDFVWTRGRAAVGIEVKAGRRWRKGHGDALKELAARGTVRRAFGIYLGEVALRDGGVEVLPVQAFLERLRAGRVLMV